jgi:hypothetical protein
MLAITLKREIPEAKKLRRIEIGSAVRPRHDQIEAGVDAEEREGEDA